MNVGDGMVVTTDTPSVRKLQRTGLQLLLSVHEVKCAQCPANKRCTLQRIATLLKIGLKPKRLEQCLKETEGEEEHPCLKYYPNRCVLCGKCIFACHTQHGRPFLTFARRGLETLISFYGEKDTPDLPCKSCLACVDICPVSALISKTEAPPQPS